jgi:hypothetical protein
MDKLKHVAHRSLICLTVVSMFAQTAPSRYTVILEDPPTAQRFPSKESMQSTEGAAYRRQIEAKQKTLRDELAKRKIRVTGTVSTVQNAIFVVATEDQVTELKKLPGVKDVVPQRKFKTQSEN